MFKTIMYIKARINIKKKNYLKAYYTYRKIMKIYPSEQCHCYYAIATSLLENIKEKEIMHELLTEVNDILDQDRLDLINKVYFLFAAGVILYYGIYQKIYEGDKAEKIFKRANVCFDRAEKLSSYKFTDINILLVYQMGAFSVLKKYNDLVDRVNQYLERYNTFRESRMLFFYKGHALSRLGREKEAIEIYSHIYNEFTLDRYIGYYLNINFDLGKCYLNQSQFDKALVYFSNVKENIDRYRGKKEGLKEIDNLINEAETNIDK